MTKSNDLPHGLKILGSFLGARLIEVRRYLYRNDLENLDPRVAEEEADGPIEFSVDNGLVLTITSRTEDMSIAVTKGALRVLGPSFTLRNISANEFWAARIGRTIEAVELLESPYPKVGRSVFGVEVSLVGAPAFVVEYISDDHHVDQLRVTGRYVGGSCARTKLVQPS